MKDLKQIAAMLADTGYKEEAEAVLQAEKDAARYRWLRDYHVGDDPESINLDPSRKNVV